MKNLIGGLLAVILAGPISAANAEPARLKVGDPAPKFSAPTETGEVWKSEDHVGEKILVVYFYPADFTGGCTKQACGFRDDAAKLREAGAELVGVSGDAPETHLAFKKHHALNFTLLADPEGEIADKFGVPHGKGGQVSFKVDGENQQFQRGATIKRWTFIIDRDGKVAYINPNVKAAQDSEVVLKEIAKLK